MLYCNSSTCRNPNRIALTASSPTNAASTPSIRTLKRASDGSALALTCESSLHAVDLHCSCCGTIMEEDVAQRVYTRSAVVYLAAMGSAVDSRDSFGGAFSRCITVTLDDDHANIIQLGDHVTLIGTLERDYDTLFGKSPVYNSTLLLRCNNVLEVNGQLQLSRAVHDDSQRQTPEIPAFVRSLWRLYGETSERLYTAKLLQQFGRRCYHDIALNSLTYHVLQAVIFTSNRILCCD